jgi:8-oxo-dGTP diphosphatase
MTGQYPEYPRVAVGGVVISEGRVLLVQRNKPPAKGEWAIPGGSVELGETLARAVQRELAEETGIIVRAQDPCYYFEAIVPDENGRVRFHYVIVDLLADYVSGEPKAGSDVIRAAWFVPRELEAIHVNARTRDLLVKLGFFR